MSTARTGGRRIGALLRRMLGGLCLLLALALGGARAGAEEVVAGLSRDTIGITTRFEGSDILIYGAVKRDAPVPEGPPMQVIVTLEGPTTSVTVRRKSRQAGIWVNTESVGVGAAASYYAVATTAPLRTILSYAADNTHRISPHLAVRAFSGPITVADATPFTEALVRIRGEQGLYRLDEGAVALIDDTLFRADFTLPANITEGDYMVRIFLVRSGAVVDHQRALISVRKVGLERFVHVLSLQAPFLYGLLALTIAVVAGWAAAAAFRLIRR